MKDKSIAKQRDAYRDQLIARGLSPDSATQVASKTVFSSDRADGQAMGDFDQLRKDAQSENAAPLPSPGVKSVASSRGRSARRAGLSTPAAVAAPAPSPAPIDARATRQPRSKATATDKLAAKVAEVTQASVLKQTLQEVQDKQLTLFDLAPWSDQLRALPNDFVRTALFTVRNKKTPRALLQRQPLFSVDSGVTITYTGPELRADSDELVYQQVLEYAKRVPIGEPVSFTFYELCKDVGWPVNGRYYDRAEECLTRLQATAMQFSSTRVGALESLSLIARFGVVGKGTTKSRCQIELEPEIAVLFADNRYTKFQKWAEYRKLSPTARRMFDYFASHAKPYPIKLETARKMCGSDSMREKKWREQCGNACEELRALGMVANAWISDDLVYCER